MPSDAEDPLYMRVLVVRCQLGERVALEELLQRTQRRLRGFVYKLLPSAQRHRLDDLMQDIWTEVFRGLPRLNDAGAFRPWLYRIARNRVYRSTRQDNQWAARLADIDVSEVADDGPPVDDFTAADAAAVHTALDQLHPQYREVVMLRYLEALTYDEIAAVVSCPIGTVRSRLHNGKRDLAVILQREMKNVRD